jgi:hypothetical protein
MRWTLFVLGAVLSWGIYGPMLHKGQVLLANPLRALLCVGIAYVLVAVLVPSAVLGTSGEMRGFNGPGVVAATAGGMLGALGAVCIIYAFRAGGMPSYVMALVFAGAPLVNVIVSALMHPPKTAPNPLLYAGYLLAALGAGLVLRYRPT